METPVGSQELDLVRTHLSWTPAQRLRNLREAADFVARVRKGRWLPDDDAEARPDR